MNVRNILHKGVLLLMSAMLMNSCSMMKEDLSDCPTGLYVNFVYDYNIQRADMFKDHVGGLKLYVFDESDRVVAQRSVSGSELSRYGYCIHFTEQELAPDHLYRLVAVAMQKDWNAASALTGYNPSIGASRTSLKVELAHQKGVPYGSVSNAAPLDTFWHTLTTLKAEAQNQPAATRYRLATDGGVSTNGIEQVSVVRGEPTYATVSLIRDTNHLNISLRELDTPEEVRDEDFEVFIIDANTNVDYANNLIVPGDSVVYRPYAQWTTVIEGTGSIASDYSAHYDLMFNRLMYNTTTNDNAVLCIRNKKTGENVAMLNLPYILCTGRMAYEIYNYSPQEYLDREYDYRLELFLKNGKWAKGSFISVCIDVLSWARRIQYVEI
ncbi:MAG: FimB/Mfa2 family fimbrial subunit [Prevotella sp.]|nr:FimB/Mfa2 family fimbrial subunit [Prevotella sp.]